MQYLSCLAIVESEMVAGLEIEGNCGVRHALQVDSQHLLGHVIVVQLVVTQSHVNFQGQEISERQKDEKRMMKMMKDVRMVLLLLVAGHEVFQILFKIDT